MGGGPKRGNSGRRRTRSRPEEKETLNISSTYVEGTQVEIDKSRSGYPHMGSMLVEFLLSDSIVSVNVARG